MSKVWLDRCLSFADIIYNLEDDWNKFNDRWDANEGENDVARDLHVGVLWCLSLHFQVVTDREEESDGWVSCRTQDLNGQSDALEGAGNYADRPVEHDRPAEILILRKLSIAHLLNWVLGGQHTEGCCEDDDKHHAEECNKDGHRDVTIVVTDVIGRRQNVIWEVFFEFFSRQAISKRDVPENATYDV